MIPTREQIEGDWIDPVYSPNTVVLGWLRAMRDEIDRLTAEPGASIMKAIASRSAVPDDTRWRLVARLASLMANHLRCSGDALDVGRCNSVDSIVSELRGGA